MTTTKRSMGAVTAAILSMALLSGCGDSATSSAMANLGGNSGSAASKNPLIETRTQTATCGDGTVRTLIYDWPTEQAFELYTAVTIGGMERHRDTKRAQGYTKTEWQFLAYLNGVMDRADDRLSQFDEDLQNCGSTERPPKPVVPAEIEPPSDDVPVLPDPEEPTEVGGATFGDGKVTVPAAGPSPETTAAVVGLVGLAAILAITSGGDGDGIDMGPGPGDGDFDIDIEIDPF